MQLLVDCNNFFASCETLFTPKYRYKPLVVSSGCIVSRSQEAKALGIPMGAAVFEYKSLFTKHDVIVCPPNFPLYSDISARIMSLLGDFGFEMEICSIDEAFITLPKESNFEYIACEIKNTIARCIGIPVSVGIAPTKTLAKLAAMIAKKSTGIYIALKPDDLPLADIPVSEIWGIGKNLSKRLSSFGIHSVEEFAKKNADWVKKYFHLFGLRTYMEILGNPSIPYETTVNRKSITHTRTFTPMISSKETLLKTLQSFTASVCVKLRKYNLAAKHISIFIATNRFDKTSYKQEVYTFTLPETSSYTPDFLAVVTKGISSIYEEGLLYKRAGVLLMGLCDSTTTQLDAFTPKIQDPSKRNSLMKATDALNARFGKGTISFASEHLYTSISNNNQRFTTNWKEIPIIYL